MSLVWSFIIYYVIAFVVSYILVEYGQKYLYDEMPPYAALRVAGGSLFMAAVLTWTHSSFDTMFTADLYKTVALILVWIGVFVLILRFQPVHGALFATAAALLLPGLATIAVDGATAPPGPVRPAANTNRTPIRRPSSPGAAPAVPVEKK